MTSHSRIALSLCACIIIAACGGRTDNLNPGAVNADSTQRLGERQSLLSCTNGAGESVGDSVFELTFDGNVYRDGEFETEQGQFNSNTGSYSYELSWISLLNDGTSRYDYLHHEQDWFYDPAISGEEFLAVEQHSDTGRDDIVSYFEKGNTGASIIRCGTSSMTDRGFLACSEAGPNSGLAIVKRKLARYDVESNRLSIEDYVRNLAPGNGSPGELLTDLGEGWQRYELETTQPSLTGGDETTTRQTIEFNSQTGIVRSLESRDSPTPRVVSCRQ